jgi:hypothetical protein
MRLPAMVWSMSTALLPALRVQNALLLLFRQLGVGKPQKNEGGTHGNPLQPVRSPVRENWPPPPRLKHWPPRNPLQKPLPSVPVHSWALSRRVWVEVGKRTAIRSANALRRTHQGSTVDGDRRET